MQPPAAAGDSSDPGAAELASRSAQIIGVLFLLLVMAKAGAYWIGSAIHWPDDPLSTIALYRGKDIQSFPIMRNLGSLGFGEPSLYEVHNSGILSERFFPWAIHAFLFQLTGPAAFIIADLLLTPLRYLLLARVFLLCGINRVTTWTVSAILTCSVIDDFGEVFPRWRESRSVSVAFGCHVPTCRSSFSCSR
jgi:hypothetical protein